MTYSKAFQCASCPKNGDEKNGPACPLWWEIVVENLQTGETRIEKSCGFRLLPQMMVEVIKATNRSTANVNEASNTMRGLDANFASLTAAVEAATSIRRIESRTSDGIDAISADCERSYLGEQPLLPNRPRRIASGE